MDNIIIFGASGHGSVVADCIERQGCFKIVGFIDSFKRAGISHSGYPVLGTELDLPYIISAYSVDAGVVAIGDNWLRMLMVDKIMDIVPDFRFISAVHPMATIGRKVVIGNGSVIMPGAIINSGSILGAHCIINTNASLDHDGIMGNFSSLAPRVSTGGNLLLGSFAAICLGASIIENIEIGDHSVIGAGALVVNHLPGHVVAFGAPAKVVRKRKKGEPYLGRTSHSSYTTSHSTT
jgi:sugar O-acyltransferase (sialic acid O-acetyltransferase NeuD family)